ncbi:MAG: DUF6638 family protein [Candidatus Sungbacteria bacterium]|nr:hypothetical protein [bacterium]MDZ4260498.1 DUF6638 family protein [Candidatus Sungbacteria bacterium]
MDHDGALKLLEDHHLYGAGLVRIDTPVMVARYNEALISLGIDPTETTSFSIDGMGWSPEVAAEKGTNLYLSHGLANHMAIILSADQEKKPLYAPFNSYDRRLITAYFSRHAQTVIDITVTTPITLEFDIGLTCVDDPFDLLLVDAVVVRASAGYLMEAVGEQKELIRRFREEPLAWADSALRDAVIASGMAYNDLRYRQVKIPDFFFEDLRSFFTQMFGGMYVFRCGDITAEQNFLVVENREMYEEKGGPEHAHVYGIHEQELVTRLFQEGLIEINLEWYRSNPDTLESRKNHIAIAALYEKNPSLDYLGMTPAQRRRSLIALKASLPNIYGELERFTKQLSQRKITSPDILSPELQIHLMRPQEALAASLTDVVWNLICKLQAIPDMLQLYRSDKNEFFRQYRTWPEGKQAWAVQSVLKHYVPTMSQ